MIIEIIKAYLMIGCFFFYLSLVQFILVLIGKDFFIMKSDRVAMKSAIDEFKKMANAFGSIVGSLVVTVLIITVSVFQAVAWPVSLFCTLKALIKRNKGE